MFGIDGLKRIMVHMHVHVPSIDVLVESLKSKHDAQHFAFNVGVATLDDDWLCTVVVSKPLN